MDSSGLGTKPIYEFYVVQSSGLQGTGYLAFLQILCSLVQVESTGLNLKISLPVLKSPPGNSVQWSPVGVHWSPTGLWGGGKSIAEYPHHQYLQWEADSAHLKQAILL